MRGSYHGASPCYASVFMGGTRSVHAIGRGLPGLLVVLGLACGDGDSDSGAPSATSGASETGGSSTGLFEEPSVGPTDICARAPAIGAGMHPGSLRGYSADLGGACGLGGPDAFFRLDVPRRSDVKLRAFGGQFVPRVGVLPHTCANDWSSRTMLCDEGVGTWLLDVPAGSSLVVSVGIDEAEPVLAEPPPSAGPDPLSFSLEVRLRTVLDEGDPCEPVDRGRCETGTACLSPPPPPMQPNAPPLPAVCTALAGDTCDSAVGLSLPVGITTVEIDPATLQTDAHEHSCGGARRRERVLRLALPAQAPHRLHVRGDRAELGFALRSPSCLLEDEVACVGPDSSPSPELSAELSGASALLFVELPAQDDSDGGGSTGDSGGDGTGGDGRGEEAPIVLELELTDLSAGE